MGSAVFSTPGTYTWSAPTSVYWPVAELWGAGGSAHNNGSLAGGGGGGAYVTTKITVSPGASYEIVVGAPVVTSGAAPFPDGGFSSISGITFPGLKAKAVGGGTGWSSFPSTNGLGGLSANCSASGTNTVINSGGDGAEGTNSDGGGGGAAGNSGGDGADAVGTTGGIGANGGGSGGNGGAGAAGQPGFSPGGGAGANGSGGGIGGKLGGDGYVSLVWGDPPVITSANSTTFAVNLSNSFTVTTTGDPTIVISITAGTLPTGVTFVDNGNGTATISGVPTTLGTYLLNLKAQNDTGYTEQLNFSLTVSQAPAITSANNTTFTVGSFGTFTVTTTGNPTVSSIVRGGVSLPTGVLFVDNGNGTGTLSGTPAALTGGVYVINFTASNGVSPDAVQNPFTLTVNEAPAITSANNTTFTVGSFGTFAVTTTGYPDPAIVRGGVSLPTGVSFVDNGDGTGTLSGTPAALTGGVYVLTFTASNSVLPNAVQNPFTLTVNESPVITSANTVTFTEGIFDTFTVTTTGYPIPIINEFGSFPIGVSFIDNGDGTGTIFGTPAPVTAGIYPLLFVADGFDPDDSQNFNLIVASSGGGGGDPHFIGFDGKKFDFHGKDGSWYNLYKDKFITINALFAKDKFTKEKHPGLDEIFIKKVCLMFDGKKIIITPFDACCIDKIDNRKNCLPRALHIDGNIKSSYSIKLPHGKVVISRTVYGPVVHLNIMINVSCSEATGIIGQTYRPKRQRLPNEDFEVMKIL